jgi:hypothetical protein
MDEFVLVPVPKGRVQEVYALLAKEGARNTVSDQVGLWTPKILERCYRESSVKTKLFLDYLAENAGRAVSGSEVGEVIKYSSHQIAGMLGAAGRRITNRYKLPWPFDWTTKDGLVVYTMNEENASVIRSVRPKV